MPLPEVQRVSYAEHAAKSAAKNLAPEDAGAVAAAACRLEPLQKIQVAFDQLANHAEGHRRGVIGPFGHDFRGYVKAELAGVQRYIDILHCAADTADAMVHDMSTQLTTLETTMSKAKDEEDEPKLTTSGEKHPLQKGGYDPNTDPQLPGNISDTEALKEGKATRAQSEAIGKADAAGVAEEEKEAKSKSKDAGAHGKDVHGKDVHGKGHK